MAILKYRCPVCSYIGKSEGELEDHIIDRISGTSSVRGYENSFPEIE